MPIFLSTVDFGGQVDVKKCHLNMYIKLNSIYFVSPCWLLSRFHSNHTCVGGCGGASWVSLLIILIIRYHTGLVLLFLSPSLSRSCSLCDRRAPALCSALRQFPWTRVPAVDVTLGSFQFRDFRWVRLRGGGWDPLTSSQQPHEEAHPAGTGLYMGQG